MGGSTSDPVHRCPFTRARTRHRRVVTSTRRWHRLPRGHQHSWPGRGDFRRLARPAVGRLRRRRRRRRQRDGAAGVMDIGHAIRLRVSLRPCTSVSCSPCTSASRPKRSTTAAASRLRSPIQDPQHSATSGLKWRACRDSRSHARSGRPPPGSRAHPHPASAASYGQRGSATRWSSSPAPAVARQRQRRRHRSRFYTARRTRLHADHHDGPLRRWGQLAAPGRDPLCDNDVEPAETLRRRGRPRPVRRAWGPAPRDGAIDDDQMPPGCPIRPQRRRRSRSAAPSTASVAPRRSSRRA